MENYESIIEPKKVYSQVYSILQLLGNSYINKIPKKLYKLIDSQRDKDYNPKYNLEISFIEQNVNKRALAINYTIIYLKRVFKIIKRMKIL